MNQKNRKEMLNTIIDFLGSETWQELVLKPQIAELERLREHWEEPVTGRDEEDDITRGRIAEIKSIICLKEKFLKEYDDIIKSEKKEVGNNA